MLQRSEILAAARDAAARAAGYIRSVERPSNPTDWGIKGTSDFVTHVDRESERLITGVLQQAFPDSQIVGEELTPGSRRNERDLTWIVDPLDGTTNFLHGYPAFAVSIAAIFEGQLTAGVVVNVDRSIEYHAVLDEGAWCGNRRLQVSNTSNPMLALIGTGYPFKTLDQLPQYLRQFGRILRSTSGIRRAGSAALDLADVAQGRFDGFWELSLAPWDVAAGAVLVREAGGRITSTDGSDDVVRHGPIVAGNPAIHDWLMEVVGSDEAC